MYFDTMWNSNIILNVLTERNFHSNPSFSSVNERELRRAVNDLMDHDWNQKNVFFIELVIQFSMIWLLFYSLMNQKKTTKCLNTFMFPILNPSIFPRIIINQIDSFFNTYLCLEYSVSNSFIFL